MSKNQISEEEYIDYQKILSNVLEMTKWLPGIMNIGVLYLIGVCNKHTFDMTDYAILTWMINYVDKVESGKGSILKKLFISKQENAKVEFVWINYQGIIDQLPIINIDDRHTISRRFKRYCEARIMEFHFDQNPQGSFTFYRINPSIKKHLVSKDPQEFVLIPELYENKELTKLFSGVVLKVHGVNKKDTPDDLNSSRFGVNVQTKDCIVTNCIVNNTTITNTLNVKIQNTVIMEILESLFGSSNGSFSEDFIPSLSKLFDKTKLSEPDQNKYLNWVFNYSMENCKDKTKLKNYFYKAAQEQNLIESFMSEKETQECDKQKHYYFCPVCKSKNKIYTKCSCGLMYEEKDDPKKVELFRRILNLSETDRASYEKECNSIYENRNLGTFNPLEFQKQENQLSLLQHKYNLID